MNLFRTWLGCACLTLLLFACGPSYRRHTIAYDASLEADMLVSRGGEVDLWLNDWEHPPERVPVVAGERHTYRFTKIPREITLIRLDPTDVPDARIVIYSLTLKAGARTVRQFGPAELRAWTLYQLSPPQETGGGLAMLDTSDDPILWTKVSLQVPEDSTAKWRAIAQPYSLPSEVLLALLLMVLLRRKLEWLFTVSAMALAIWILVTTVNVARVGWAPVPIGDDWDRWRTYVGAPSVLYWYFQQHIDHRLLFPKMVFEIDHFLFHARGWFTLLCTFCLQALTAFLLWRLSAHVCPQDRRERLVLASVIAACLFSAQQWVNFILPFQVQFPMVYAAATVALFSLWKGAQDNWRNGAWAVVASAAATVATYSMANGVLLWPVLLLAAFWLRMPRRWLAASAAYAMVIGTSFFYHWYKTPSLPRPLGERVSRAVIFLLANLGSPMTPIALMRDSDNARLTVAAIPGALLAVGLLTAFVILWRRRERFSNAIALLIFYGVFLAGSSVSMAYGRSDLNLMEAFTPRYLTPIYILWMSMLVAAWPLLRRLHRSTLYAVLCVAMFAGIAAYQESVTMSVRVNAGIFLGEVALVDNVTDATAWPRLYHTPRIVMNAVDYMRDHHLSLFLEEWTHWPGIRLKDRFVVDPDPAACQGRFEPAAAVSSPIKPGWRVGGWAWDVKAGRPPHWVILADEADRVAGVALTGFTPAPDATAEIRHHADALWIGYVDGLARPITAYVVEADDRSLCAIGNEPLQLPASH